MVHGRDESGEWYVGGVGSVVCRWWEGEGGEWYMMVGSMWEKDGSSTVVYCSVYSCVPIILHYARIFY